MSQQFYHSLAAEFPEYVELNSLLSLAAKTWPRFGIDAAQLSEMDDFQLEMIRIMFDDR